MIVNNVNVFDKKTLDCDTPACPNKNTAFLDSAASVSCMGKEANCPRAKTQVPNISLDTPSNVPIRTTETLELPMNKLPQAAKKAYRVGEIPHNIMAAAELCDAGCSVHLYKHNAAIDYEGETLYRGWRDRPSRLWRFNINPDHSNRLTPLLDEDEYDPASGMVLSAVQWSINAIYECSGAEELTKYYHASLGSHPKSTLIAAAKAGYLKGFPGFTQERISKFIKIEDATEAGHLRKTPAGTRSTTTKSKRGRPSTAKETHAAERQAAMTDAMTVPLQEPSNKKTNLVFMTVMLADGMIASDQTGAFPRVSNRGKRYISVFYVYDANFIKGRPIKSRHRQELLSAYEEIYKWCTARGFKPQLQRMDNETSQEVEDFIQSQNADVQYSAPGSHCPPAEKAVQTYKSCFKSVTASLPNSFPIGYWCRLCEQVDLCVNIVRACRRNPLLSAWAACEGDFHFDSTPIAPPGTEMLMHNKNKKTWDHNALKAWYIGPCLKHWRSFKGILPSTGAERMSDTVKMKHHAIAIPELTPADRILEATKQLKDAIQQQPQQAPMEEIAAIELLREVLLGERKEELPLNSVQKERAKQREMPAIVPEQTTTHSGEAASGAGNTPEHSNSWKGEANYISDDEDEGSWNKTPGDGRRRSKRVLQQLRANEKDDLHNIVMLAANETATVPEMHIKSDITKRGYAAANQHLQLDEWAYEQYFAGAVIDKKTGESLEYRDLIKRPEIQHTWFKALANELGRLSQGIRDIKGTNTIFFIPKYEIPKERWKDITYGRIVVGYKPDKLEKNRARLTVGGDRIDYPYAVSAPTCDLPTIKLLWNSVISTPGAKYFTMDISNFYLGSPMKRPEYMRMPIKLIPDEIIQEYDLLSIVTDGWVYIKIARGMYGLPQAGKLANDLLKERLAIWGYYPAQFTPGLWRHVWRPVTFTLVVDDFGVKFVDEANAEHLKMVLEKYYDITVDWEGKKYVGIDLKWDYQKRTVDTSVNGYVEEALHKVQHKKPTKPQDAPAKAIPIQYGAKVQKTNTDTSPRLSAEGIKAIQEVVGIFNWYSRAADPTMARTLSSIAARQAKATTKVKEEVKQFLDYCATHSHATVRFLASDMILALHSDASYLSEPESKSRAAGHYYLANKNNDSLSNGAVMTLSKIIKHVMTSASEAEVAALFYNCKAAQPLRITLEEMGHPQPKTPVITDNKTAEGLSNKTMVPNKAKTYDMRFNWLKCRQAQEQFDLIWRPGKVNKADYHSKVHPTKHYVSKRKEFVLDRQ